MTKEQREEWESCIRLSRSQQIEGWHALGFVSIELILAVDAELTALREENERLTKAYQELELLVSQAQPESHWLGEGKTT